MQAVFLLIEGRNLPLPHIRWEMHRHLTEVVKPLREKERYLQLDLVLLCDLLKLVSVL
jgi:hypothetical protein